MHPMIIAARLVVRDMGGAERAAEHLGKSGTTLSHELNPNYPGAKLGLLDAATLTAASGDLRILQAFADEAGALVLKLPAVVGDQIAHGGMLRLAKLATQCGELMSKGGAALADDDVNDVEMQLMQALGLDLAGALHEFLVYCAQRNQAGKQPLRAVA